MAEDRREQPLGIGAGQREVVGVADAGRLDLDQHLARLSGRRADRLDRQRRCPALRATAARVSIGSLQQRTRPQIDRLEQGPQNLVIVRRPYSGSTDGLAAGDIAANAANQQQGFRAVVGQGRKKAGFPPAMRSPVARPANFCSEISKSIETNMTPAPVRSNRQMLARNCVVFPVDAAMYRGQSTGFYGYIAGVRGIERARSNLAFVIFRLGGIKNRECCLSSCQRQMLGGTMSGRLT